MTANHSEASSAQPEKDQDAATFWEARYANSDRIWSGRVNAVLEFEVSALTPGSALDLGCGEGGDSAWLAEHGWLVTAVDIAASAIERARQLVAAREIPEGRISWQRADLASWRPDRSYDLVSACFLHSPVEFPRTAVLLNAAGAVAAGGHLLIVGHAAAPSWAPPAVADHAGHAHGLMGANEQLIELDLPDAAWHVIVCENRERSATGPDGQAAVLEDAVLLLERQRTS